MAKTHTPKPIYYSKHDYSTALLLAIAEVAGLGERSEENKNLADNAVKALTRLHFAILEGELFVNNLKETSYERTQRERREGRDS